MEFRRVLFRSGAPSAGDGSAGQRRGARARRLGLAATGVNSMRQFLSSTLVVAAMCAPLAAQDAEVARQTITLGDPGKPATLDVNMVMGSITVKGSNRKDVLIETRGSSPAAGARPPRQNRPDEPPPPGLRRLTQRPPIDIDQDRNTISTDAASPLRSVDFHIEVPL